MLILVSALALAATPFGAPAFAASKTVVTSVSPGAGPLAPTNIVIKGKHLSAVKAVRFGKMKGRIVGSPKAGSLTVRTPAGVKPGTVSVQVRTAAGWSQANAKARYSFVATPRLSSLAPASGPYVGGTRVTISGKNLSTASKVLFGDQKAKILSRKKNALVVRTPIGVLGDASVSVVTAGGTATNSRVTFEYVEAGPEDSFQATPSDTTFVADEVDWVTGGYDADADVTEPWVVSLPSGAPSPAVGQQFLLRPGSQAFPSGLAGTVTEVAEQVDGSLRVTVTAADLDKVVDLLSVDYSGPVVDPSLSATRPAAARAGALAVDLGTAFEFSLKGPTALSCKSERDGSEVSFGADVTSRITDVDVSQHLDAGSVFRRPSFDGSLTAEVQTTGKITVSAASTCKIKPAWQNAHRKVIPLGTSGATVSFAPTAEFKISGKGTWSVTDRTRMTFSVSATLGRTPTYSRTARSVESTQSGELTFEAEVDAGVSVQFGILDRAGVQAKLTLGASVALTASTAPNVCIDGELFAKLSVGVFLDAFVARWERDAFTAKLTLVVIHKCVLSEGPAFSNEPEITSARLPDATIGTGYSTTLSTADNRGGNWSVVRFALPAGLTLSSNGVISGTPQGPVQDNAVIVDFQDASGAVATTTIRILVKPSRGLGGGDIQATLRWTGAADLDLHLVDPSGQEIYYASPTSTSGGRLDRDANAGCNGPADDDNAVENIFWPPASAPAGAYTAWVKVYATCDAPLDWHLTVRRNGVIVLDEVGTGDSPNFAFTLGSSAARAAVSREIVSPAAEVPKVGTR